MILMNPKTGWMQKTDCNIYLMTYNIISNIISVYNEGVRLHYYKFKSWKQGKWKIKMLPGNNKCLRRKKLRDD